MIRRLSANKSTFTAIDFGPGLNVLLAERAANATRRNSRNARGKTSVVQAINFCLGANLIQDMKSLGSDGWAFTLEFDFRDTIVSVTRDVANPATVRVSAQTELPPLLAPFVGSDGSVLLADWKQACGLAFFGLDVDADRRDALSARTLISYVVRVDTTKDPLKILPQQSAVSARKHIAYLLGLDWTLPAGMQHVRSSEEALKGLLAASEQQILEGLQSEDDLLIRQGDLRREMDRLSGSVTGFRVIEDREDLITRADALTSELVELRNTSMINRRLITMYQDSLTALPAEDSAILVAEVFEEVGRTFREAPVRTLAEVQEFHHVLSSNRSRYLQRELSRLNEGNAGISSRLRVAETERARILRILESAGALAELISMQGELAQLGEQLGAVEQSLLTIRQSRRRMTELRSERAALRAAVSEDIAIHQSEIDELSSAFSSLVAELYGSGGAVSTDADDWGPRVKISVETPASAGVNKMKLLCFDVALMFSEQESGRHPGFLVHDSFVYEGVDSRQVSSALQIIAQQTLSRGTQYICTLNSDAVAPGTNGADWFNASIRRQVLDTEVGGFMGVRF